MKGLDLTIGLRVSAEEEELGLDSSLHGESLHAEQAGQYTVNETGEIQMKVVDANGDAPDQKLPDVEQSSGTFLVDLEKGDN